jgi:hypothetical protein
MQDGLNREGIERWQLLGWLWEKGGMVMKLDTGMRRIKPVGHLEATTGCHHMNESHPWHMRMYRPHSKQQFLPVTEFVDG